MGQFICQIFRTAILSSVPAPSLSPEVQQALSTIRAYCEEDGVTNSVVPRFPFRIVLNEFATALSSPTPSQTGSILSYLAHLIQKRTDVTVSPSDLREWLANYPVVLIFDGPR